MDINELAFYKEVLKDFDLARAELDLISENVVSNDGEIVKATPLEITIRKNYISMKNNLQMVTEELTKSVKFANDLCALLEIDTDMSIPTTKDSEEICLLVDESFYPIVEDISQSGLDSFIALKGLKKAINSGKLNAFNLIITNHNIREQYELLEPIYNQSTLNFKKIEHNDLCMIFDVNDLEKIGFSVHSSDENEQDNTDDEISIKDLSFYKNVEKDLELVKKEISKLEEELELDYIIEDGEVVDTKILSQPPHYDTHISNCVKMEQNMAMVSEELKKNLILADTILQMLHVDIRIHEYNEDIVLSIEPHFYSKVEEAFQNYPEFLAKHEEFKPALTINRDLELFSFFITNRNIRKKYKLLDPIYNQPVLSFTEKSDYFSDYVVVDANDIQENEVLL